MFSTSRVYEAYSKVSDFSITLDPSYEASATSATWVAAIFAFALVLFAAIAIKRARPFGIVTAVFQPIGLFAALNFVLEYSKIDFASLEMKTTSTSSMSDAMNKLYEKLAEAFFENVFPQMIAMLFWAMLMFITFIITLIYAIQLIRAKCHGFAVGALILIIVRYLFIAPIEFFSVIIQNLVPDMPSIWEYSQTAWDGVYRFFILLPIILIGIQGLVNLISNAKAKRNSVLVAESAPVKEEAASEPVAETKIEAEADSADDVTAPAEEATE